MLKQGGIPPTIYFLELHNSISSFQPYYFPNQIIFHKGRWRLSLDSSGCIYNYILDEKNPYSTNMAF